MISGDVTGIQVADTSPRVNHLLFADDCILFSKANVAEVGKITKLLAIYCGASGQRINNDKSSIYFGKGCAEQLRASIKVLLEVDNQSLNERYIGLP